MTDDLRFQRSARDWLELGPAVAPADVVQSALLEIQTTPQERDLRVPWRIHPMPTFARALATVVVVIGVMAGGVLILQRANPSLVGGPAATASPSPTPPATPAAVGQLARTYTSAGNAYSILHPADWSVTPASQSWQPGTETPWGDPALDVLQGPNARLVIASQRIETPEVAWYTAYCERGGTDSDTCRRYATTWPRIPIGEAFGYVTLDGVPAFAGTITPGGPIFDAVVVANRRGYEFTLDGDVDRAAFERLLASVRLLPPGPESVDNLTQPFTSPLYGYTILLDPAWTVTPATTPRADPLSEETFGDVVTVTGSDSTISVAASPLGDRTWDELLAQLRANATGTVPEGCEGGDPASWPTVAVGDGEGRVQQLCNAAIVYALDGQTVYEFDWSNATFDGSSHLSESDFFEILKGVTLPAP